jgi:hypothetical protein
VTSNEPGDRRRLAQPPSSRYAAPEPENPQRAAASALPGPLGRAIVAAVIGAAALLFVGAILASTFGLLLVAGAMGAGVGLVIARAAAPGERGGRPVTRAAVVRVAIAIALLAVVAAYVAIWLYARSEGGTLDLLDYLWTTFGPFVPGVAVIAVVTAAWGATAGPVQR